MAIVTSAYYSDTFYGETVATTDFDRYEAKAERIITRITHGRAAEDNFAALPSWQQTAVKDAICEQIQYFVYYGIDVASAGRQSAGFSVGQVKIDGSAQIPLGATSTACPAAIAALEQTGLMNPQVDTVGAPALLPWGLW